MGAHRRRSFEQLEDRRLLSISWTGAAHDNLWSTAKNWDSNTVPTSTDDVVIGSTGNPMVLVDASFSAHNVSVMAGATVSTNANCTLTVQSVSVAADGQLWASSGTLNINASSTIDGTLGISAHTWASRAR